jgi:4-hydroxy-tetrahydrodipicolinate synthase
MITPLRSQDHVDFSGLERLIERMIAGGVHGLFALGTTGEGPSLSYATRHQLVGQVCEQVSGRVPVLVGITDTSFDESVELAHTAYDSGAAGLVVAAPYYLPLSQEELAFYIEQLAREVPLPLFLYNMPSCTKVEFAPQTVARLAAVDGVAGLKDSSGDLDYLRSVRSLVADRPEFTLLVGPEELLPAAMEAGAHGGVNGGANMFPRLYVALYEAIRQRDEPTKRRLHALVMEISRTIYSIGNDASRHIRGTKSALKWLGVCDDFVALPFRRFEGEERERIGDHVRVLCERLGDIQPCAVMQAG